ncbi:uncharacterized protein LOC131949602 isoform X3 [Physella acuta]|uniref:uncharacterized protein LOC131949602 isoform X3 n=1 Tax=Physella acuta TaxID=109671 RepID=UPI0027DD4811|nr:uncharacterized protein LOC131949602 isoform X3 [Physella acuta]
MSSAASTLHTARVSGGVCTCRYGYERKNTDNRCTERYKHKLEPFDVPRAINCSTTNPTPCNSWNSSICDAQAGECRCKHRSALKDNKTCVSVQTYKITLNFTSILLLSNDPYDYFPFNYSENYGNSSHPEYKKLAARITELGLKNMFNSSKHRDRYVSSEVVSLDPSSNTGTGVLATVLLHLTPLAEDYTNVTKLAEIIQMFTSDFQANSKESVLGKSLIKVKMPFNSAHVADYNECSSKERNDCDVNANCLNTLGSFMCVCKPMYDDMAEKHNIHTRGRVCKLPSDDRKQGSDVCSSDHCTIKWEYVAWALTLFLLLILAFITYEIFQRKEDFSARKLYEKFGTTKIRKLRQASMRRLQESKRKKQEESKLKKEELKRKKEESKKKKEEEKKQKTEGKSTKVKKGKKKTDADVEDVEEIPEPGLVEIIYPPSIPFAGSESVDVDITNLPGNMDITIDRQSVIEESSV